MRISELINELNKMKTILITGAHGFLGRNLCESLIENHTIVPITRDTGTDLELIFKNNKIIGIADIVFDP